METTTEGKDSCVFEDMNLKPKLLEGIYNYGYKYPSKVQQQLIAALQNGHNVFGQEPDPGKIATICLGILQLFDFTDHHQFKALVVTYSHDSALKIAEDMRELGQDLGVKVHVLDFPYPNRSQNLDGIDVIVGHCNGFAYLFGFTRIEHIKMIVLNEPETMSLTTVKFIFQKLKDQDYRIGIFTETEPLGKVGDYVATELKTPVHKFESEGPKLSFKGVKEHQLVTFDDQKSKIITLKGLLRSHCTKTASVIFVGHSGSIDFLFKEMQDLNTDDGWKVLVTSKKMNQNDRDKIAQDLSHPAHLLITTEEWARGIDFRKVECVFYYDMRIYDPNEYLRCMGRFSKATAFTFVTRLGMDFLFHIQKQYYKEVVFKVSPLVYGPRGFSSESQPILNDKDLPDAAQGIKHFSIDVESESWKSTMLEDVASRYLHQTKSVIFVNTFSKVESVSRQMGELKVVTTLQELLGSEPPCVLITTDKLLLDIAPPREVPWVINFDLPLSPDAYSRRIAWCRKDGFVLHFVTVHDWCKLFYVQSTYEYILTLDSDDLGEQVKFAAYESMLVEPV